MDFERQDEYRRLLPFLKPLLVLPHLVALIALIALWAVATIPAFFAVLFTGRYPNVLWELRLGVYRWSSRVTAYGLLMTDKYPPFTLADDPDYPVRLRVEYPERVARWRPLLSWLLSLPFLLLAVLMMVVVEILTVLPLISILVERHFPRGLYDLFARTLLLGNRAQLYADFMVERPPSFAPGLWRAFWASALGVAFSFGLVAAVRAAYGWEVSGEAFGDAVLLVSLIAAPMFFLVGLGAFDYWFYWAAGRPTRPEWSSGHGAYSWRDYFRVNTDHEVTVYWIPITLWSVLTRK